MTLYNERNNAILQILLLYNIDSVLDCGCGNGRLLKTLSESNRFRRLAGIDNSIKQITKAKKNNVSNNVSFFCKSFFDLNSDFNFYDAIIASEVIEHFSKNELHEFIHIMFHVLSPKIVIITTPNKDYNHNYEKLYNGLRHSSHQFEFNELEVKEFANDVEKTYPDYSASCNFCDENGSSHLIVFERCKDEL